MLKIIGYLAAVTGAIALVPEVIKAFRSHHLQDVSWAMLWIGAVNSVLWAWYGIGTNDIPLIASAVLNILLNALLLIMKSQYEITRKPLLHILNKKSIKNGLAIALEREALTTEPQIKNK